MTVFAKPPSHRRSRPVTKEMERRVAAALEHASQVTGAFRTSTLTEIRDIGPKEAPGNGRQAPLPAPRP